MVDEGIEAIELDGLRLGWFSTISLMLLILLRLPLTSLGVDCDWSRKWSWWLTRGLLVYLTGLDHGV